MRTLVTGAAGFIGSHLCERLLSLGDDVLAVDNYASGTTANLPLGVEPLRHDITWPLYVEVDRIFHLACPASPVFYQRDPVQTTKTAVLGSINVLGLAKRLGARVLLTSTSEVYGDPLVHPQTEDYWGNVNPVGPRACYDEGKRCAETLFFDYHRQHDLPIRVARIFNTYGPRMRPDDGRVVSNMIMAALAGQPIPVYGGGHQTRSFCYVDDMVDGLVRLMDLGDAGPTNLGNPHEVEVVDLARMVVEATGSSSSIEHRPLPVDDPARRCPDITRARERLGWHPLTPLHEGLDATVDYFRAWHKR